MSEFIQPEHKTVKRSQPETTGTILNLIKHCLGAIFGHAGLGAGQELSTKPAYKK